MLLAPLGLQIARDDKVGHKLPVVLAGSLAIPPTPNPVDRGLQRGVGPIVAPTQSDARPFGQGPFGGSRQRVRSIVQPSPMLLPMLNDRQSGSRGNWDRVGTVGPTAHLAFSLELVEGTPIGPITIGFCAIGFCAIRACSIQLRPIGRTRRLLQRRRVRGNASLTPTREAESEQGQSRVAGQTTARPTGQPIVPPTGWPRSVVYEAASKTF